MNIQGVLDRLRTSGTARFGDAWDPAEPPLEPHTGEIVWTPPASYRAAATAGLRSAARHVVSIDSKVGFSLLIGDERTSANADLVYLPDGVSRDPGVYLTTNHLVGFAEARHEAIWCFDVSAPDADGEYPVYYHHQDEPRARLVAGGAWEDPTTQPDFASFTQWLESMTAALVAPEAPGWFEQLGRAGLTFVNKRLTLA